jgi:hypothetical protein
MGQHLYMILNLHEYGYPFETKNDSPEKTSFHEFSPICTNTAFSYIKLVSIRVDWRTILFSVKSSVVPIFSSKPYLVLRLNTIKGTHGRAQVDNHAGALAGTPLLENQNAHSDGDRWRPMRCVLSAGFPRRFVASRSGGAYTGHGGPGRLPLILRFFRGVRIDRLVDPPD